MGLRAAIVAGGRGERMRPATDATPKPMLPLLGKPLLEHQLGWLKRSGIDDVFLCLGYKAEAVQEHFGDGSRWGMKLRYSVESSPRGTAGAVKDLGDRGGADLLVVYGDLFISMDVGRLAAFHASKPGAATLVVWDTDHPQDSDLAEVTDGRVTRFYRAGPGEPAGGLALAAVWLVRPSLLELVPADRPSDFGRDVFPAALKAGLVLNAYKTGETVEDVGTFERMERFTRKWERRMGGGGRQHDHL
ncbi:MAG: nucleotidyltransferase family protein [Elusimicrobia bacterium]|nr:nucleotidyltransferase family protein [Elusimicrobiota bacterium]